MVVFNTGRPVRCEAILPSDAYGPTPAGRAGRGQFSAGKRVKDAETVVLAATANFTECFLVQAVSNRGRYRGSVAAARYSRPQSLDVSTDATLQAPLYHLFVALARQQAIDLTDLFWIPSA